MKTIKIREIEDRDQNVAFEIWKSGMTHDLGELFLKYFMRKKRMKLFLFVVLLVPIIATEDSWKHSALWIACAVVASVYYYCKYF